MMMSKIPRCRPVIFIIIICSIFIFLFFKNPVDVVNKDVTVKVKKEMNFNPFGENFKINCDHQPIFPTKVSEFELICIESSSSIKPTKSIEIEENISLEELTTTIFDDIRRGNFKSAFNYFEITAVCRDSLKENLQDTICTPQQLLKLDNYLESMLKNGVNQRAPEAEIALYFLTFSKASDTLEKILRIEQLVSEKQNKDDIATLENLKLSYFHKINIAMDILKEAQPNNPRAEELLIELEETGLAKMFNI